MTARSDVFDLPAGPFCTHGVVAPMRANDFLRQVILLLETGACGRSNRRADGRAYSGDRRQTSKHEFKVWVEYPTHYLSDQMG